MGCVWAGKSRSLWPKDESTDLAAVQLPVHSFRAAQALLIHLGLDFVRVHEVS